MKYVIAIMGLLLLASCVSNVDSSRLVLSEPNDNVSVQTLTHTHDLRISEDRVLFYNGEEKFLVPEGQRVIFESNGSDEPTFTLLDKDGRHFQFNFDF